MEKSISKSIKFDKTKVIQRGKSESMKFLIIAIFAIIIGVSSAFAYSENTLPESIKASTHGYEINLMFSNGVVSGTMISDNHTINVNNIKVIERNNKFLISDKQNDLKILAKLVGQEKYLVLIKINSDDVKTKFRFLTESNANKSQRNLMDEYLQNQKQQLDIENMSFRELQNYLKQQKIDEILQKQKEIRDTNANDYSSGQSIIDTYKDAQKTTGTALVVEEETTEPKVAEQYIPELIMTTSHDFTTYWKETFNIEVRTYDSNINSNPDVYPFEGKLDGVDISVTLSLDNEQVATLDGITQYGQWKGEYFIKENISIPGEYVVDVIATLNGQSISKSSSMFIIGSVSGTGSSNNNPTANAGPDQPVDPAEPVGILEPVTLDGSGSIDRFGGGLTFSWNVTSVPDGSGITTNNLSDSTAVGPTFTLDVVGVYTIQLTVTDTNGITNTDTVTITVT